MRDELLQSLQVLCIELDVVVACPLHPQRLHSPRTALIHGQPVREVNDLVLRPMDDQHRGGDFGDLVDAAKYNQELRGASSGFRRTL